VSFPREEEDETKKSKTSDPTEELIFFLIGLGPAQQYWPKHIVQSDRSLLLN
jgi:hypothetical protein